MKIEQLYTGCLAQGAYYIESNGEAAIIDPLRETKPYVELARDRETQIKYIFETHFHADFVSGHVDLARETGAQIVYGPGAKTKYDKYEAFDGEEFPLGAINIKALHTPGHTPESTCFLVLDQAGEPQAVFTGDTLFIGDVGRPDLAQKSTNMTTEELAGCLYDSIQAKILTLPDHVIVYPAHGAGSACGKNMSTETTSTIGAQKETNYALRAGITREEFIEEVTAGLLPPPSYFEKNAALNKSGYESIAEVMQRGEEALDPDAFELVANAHSALLLDVRSKEEFVAGFIPNSIFIGLDGSFAPWVGALVRDLTQPILIVAPVEREEETVRRLARVGYDHCLGYLKGSFASWQAAGKAIDRLPTIGVDQLSRELPDRNNMVLDVRRPDEYKASHIAGSQNFPLDFINKNMAEIDRSNSYYLHCRSGYRSTVAGSILKARGFERLINIHGLFEEIEASTIEITRENQEKTN